ncbi:MAG: hypothetical protein DRQ55_02755 [Planctomycetota bacterium]|nr:MAG: hypothetical protein DRQ55_02755 [Planctomycetota bacterium]
MPKNARPAGLSKEKKQLLILGALALVLVGVVASQPGDDSGSTPAPSTDTEPVAAAATAPAEAGPAPAGARSGPVEANSVLSAQAAADGVNDGVFESFWSVAAPMEAQVEELPPPPITINATMMAETGAMAVIDGVLRRGGDMIAGWSIDSIQMRQVTLRSPGDRLVTVTMPLLQPPVLVSPEPIVKAEESPAPDPAVSDA